MKVVFYRDPNHELTGFTVSGHAGYAPYGQDIVCSAVSALTENTVNSIEKFTDVKSRVKVDEDAGLLDYHLKGSSPEARLLMESLYLGLTAIQESYGEYLELLEEDTGSC